MSFDEVVIGSGETVSELRRSGGLQNAMLDTHARSVGSRELEGRKLGG